MIKSIFHININVKDFDRSLEFYQNLGFKVVLNIGEGANPANDKGLNIPHSVGRSLPRKSCQHWRSSRHSLCKLLPQWASIVYKPFVIRRKE